MISKILKKLTSRRSASGVMKSRVKPIGPLVSSKRVMVSGVAPFTGRKYPFTVYVFGFYKQKQFVINMDGKYTVQKNNHTYRLSGLLDELPSSRYLSFSLFLPNARGP